MYQILSENTIEKLTLKVKKLLKHPDNWTERGGIAVEGSGKDVKYLQAMVRASTTPLMEDLKSELCDDHAKIMINAGADINARDKQGITPLMFGAAFSTPELVKLLIAKKADVNAKDEEGNTPLYWAVCHSDKVENVQLLIKAGADVNAVTLGGFTILMAALVNNDNMGIIRSLIDKDADVNAKYDGYEIKGVTPLMFAIEHHHKLATIKRLLEAGADVNAEDSHGKTAWVYATLADCNKEIFDLLKEFGAVEKEKY